MNRPKFKAPVASESQEQRVIFRWCDMMKNRCPELDLLIAVPNGGHRHPAVAAKLKAEGVKAGVSDMLMLVPRGKYHGLAIELKRTKGGQVSDKQKDFQARLNEQGYLAVVCYGSNEAITAIENYLNLGVFTG